MLSGYIETNPGRDPSYSISFSFFHWNLNSIATITFFKISLLQAYNSIRKFDIISLYSSYHSGYDQLVLAGYNSIGADNPNNIMRGVVCI